MKCPVSSCTALWTLYNIHSTEMVPSYMVLTVLKQDSSNAVTNTLTRNQRFGTSYSIYLLFKTFYKVCD